jgi:hypothetical protein
VIRRLALALALLPACVVQYTVGGADTDTTDTADAGDPTHTTCPEDQVMCDGQCAPACTPGDTDDPPTSDGDGTGDTNNTGDQNTGDQNTGDTNTGDQDTGAPTCGDGQILCDDTCLAPEACQCAACDPDRETCEAGACVCRPGLTRCGDACVDLRSDPEHCSDCDDSCNGGVCQSSTCREGCFPEHADCDGACVLTKEDSLHCGDCATLCAADEVCLAGTCRPYALAADCAACPCPSACEGDAAQDCCDSAFLDAPVCVDGPCTGD